MREVYSLKPDPVIVKRLPNFISVLDSSVNPPTLHCGISNKKVHPPSISQSAYSVSFKITSTDVLIYY